MQKKCHLSHRHTYEQSPCLIQYETHKTRGNVAVSVMYVRMGPGGEVVLPFPEHGIGEVVWEGLGMYVWGRGDQLFTDLDGLDGDLVAHHAPRLFVLEVDEVEQDLTR